MIWYQQGAHSVSSSQVNAKPSGPCAQQKDKDIRSVEGSERGVGVEGIEEGDKIRRYHSQLQLQHKYPHIMPLNEVAM